MMKYSQINRKFIIQNLILISKSNEATQHARIHEIVQKRLTFSETFTCQSLNQLNNTPEILLLLEI